MSKNSDDKNIIKKRLVVLRKEIKRLRDLYHIQDLSEIPDAALDSLKRELFELEEKYPDLVVKNSPSQTVAGKAKTGFKKVVHQSPILSLQDAFSRQDLNDWEERNVKILNADIKEYFCELKMDGLTIVLTYYDGQLVTGATRGDGKIGEDVTNNVRTIKSIPQALKGGKEKWPGEITVRGEVVMSKQTFDRLNKVHSDKGSQQMANPRNAAAGSVRQLNPLITKDRDLDCFVFELITDCGQVSHSDSHKILKQMGFLIGEHDKICRNLNEVEDFLLTWQDKRKQLDFGTDGAVIIVNDVKTEKRLGSVGKAERWMIAYKFPAEEATTILENVIFQIGRSGVITPVAILKPVKLAGSVVSRATLHNQDEIKRLNLMIGDTVVVRKAGDIIPDVIQVLFNLRDKTQKTIKWPKVCPVCQSLLEKKDNEVNWYCLNKNCPGKQNQRFIFFASKTGFDIPGLGIKIVEQLVEQGFVNEPADFFKLTKEDFLQLDGFAEKKADNLIEAILLRKKIPLAKFITALGIRHVGQETAIALSAKFSSLTAIRSATLEDLLQVEDIGGVVAESIYEFFHTSYGQRIVDNLLDAGVTIIKHESKNKVNGPLVDAVVVVTGSLENYSRDGIKDRLRQAGAKVSESVSSKTTYLVAGSDPGSKLSQAQKLGVEVLTESDLEKLLNSTDLPR